MSLHEVIWDFLFHLFPFSSISYVFIFLCFGQRHELVKTKISETRVFPIGLSVAKRFHVRKKKCNEKTRHDKSSNKSGNVIRRLFLLGRRQRFQDL